MSYAPSWPCKLYRHHCAAAAPMTPFQSRINQASSRYRGLTGFAVSEREILASERDDDDGGDGGSGGGGDGGGGSGSGSGGPTAH